MLTPGVAYLGKMEQLTDAGRSLGGQPGNPPEAPNWSTATHWTALPQNTEAAQAHQQQHFSSLLISAQDMGKAVVFLTPSSFQL